MTQDIQSVLYYILRISVYNVQNYTECSIQCTEYYIYIV